MPCRRAMPYSRMPRRGYTCNTYVWICYEMDTCIFTNVRKCKWIIGASSHLGFALDQYHLIICISYAYVSRVYRFIVSFKFCFHRGFISDYSIWNVSGITQVTLSQVVCDILCLIGGWFFFFHTNVAPHKYITLN